MGKYAKKICESWLDEFFYENVIIDMHLQRDLKHNELQISIVYCGDEVGN